MNDQTANREYIKGVAKLLGLESQSDRPEVLEHFQRLAALANLISDFPVDKLESAPTFEP